MIELAGHAIASDCIAAVGPVRPCFKVGKGQHATFVVCLKGGQSLQLEYEDDAVAQRDRASAVAALGGVTGAGARRSPSPSPGRRTATPRAGTPSAPDARRGGKARRTPH